MKNRFAHNLIDWYLQNKRDLPWRQTKDPYKIWLSEIILQQTRVDQGMNYYLKFIKNYPTIIDLANASEQEVLNDWQGLGYYSRARNLHATAKLVASELNGIFPNSYDTIIKLKGVGPYTAAAISSFAFQEKKALVDGNVYRLLARYFDVDLAIDSTIGKKEFQLLADELISNKNPDIYNQAIMEFGALQCTPNNPNCENCVLVDSCLAFANKTVTLLPVKEKKTKTRNRYFYFGVFFDGERICIEKRVASDIWQHLYQFPLLETTEEKKENAVLNDFQEQYGLEPKFISQEVKHILSHQKILARFVHFSSIPNSLENSAVTFAQLENYPLPRVIDRYLEQLDFDSL